MKDLKLVMWFLELIYYPLHIFVDRTKYFRKFFPVIYDEDDENDKRPHVVYVDSYSKGRIKYVLKNNKLVYDSYKNVTLWRAIYLRGLYRWSYSCSEVHLRNK